MHRYTEMLDKLEHQVAVHGLKGCEPEMARIAEILVRTGTLPTVAGILADMNEPEPARLRALGRGIRALRLADATPVLAAAPCRGAEDDHKAPRSPRRVPTLWRRAG